MKDPELLLSLFNNMDGERHTLEVKLSEVRAWHAEIERLRRDLGFVALWAWRDSKNGHPSASERLSAIKYHPAVKAAYEQNGDG